VSFDPDLGSLATTLAELAARNGASVVLARIQSARSKNQHEATVAELSEMITELSNERAQLLLVAQAYQDEVASQKVSPDEIRYINDSLIPMIQQLLPSQESGAESGTVQVLDQIKSLLSVESLTILQLIGFNFKEAIGQPLTTLVERAILSRVQDASNTRLAELSFQRDTALFQLLQDPEGRESLNRLNNTETS